MAKRSTKGANFLARERGLRSPSGHDRVSGGPTFVSSCANLFSKRGDDWLTPREQDKEFPLRQSVLADEPLSPEQLRIAEIRRKMKSDIHQAKMIKTGELLHLAVQNGDNTEAMRLTEEFVLLRETRGKAEQDFKPPQLRVHVDPDMDMFTKAIRKEERKEFVDVQGKAVENDPQRKASAALHAMRQRQRESKCIESKRATASRHKVKGSFYRFEDVGDKLQDATKHAPRPFLGITPAPKDKPKRRKKK